MILFPLIHSETMQRSKGMIISEVRIVGKDRVIGEKQHWVENGAASLVLAMIIFIA